MTASPSVGIDVGLSGAIGAVDANGDLPMIDDLPLLARGKGRVKHELDAAALARLVRPNALEVRIVVVEAVAARPGQGVCGVFSLGHSLCVIVGVVQAVSLPVLLVSAARWKRHSVCPPTGPCAPSRHAYGPMLHRKGHGTTDARKPFSLTTAAGIRVDPSSGKTT